MVAWIMDYMDGKVKVRYYINHIDFFSIHANVCAQKSLKRTCAGFDPVTP